MAQPSPSVEHVAQPLPSSVPAPPAPQQAVAAAPAKPRSRRKLWLILFVVALLGAGAAAAALTGQFSSGDTASNNGPSLKGPDTAPFSMDHPKTWRALTVKELATLPGGPLAVLRRKDGRGTVVITERGPVAIPLDQLATQLKGRLNKRFSDFREIGAKTVSLKSGRALVYTFARTKTGTAQSLVVVPGEKRSYTLNAIVPPRSPDAAREVGAMIASFQTNGAK